MAQTTDFSSPLLNDVFACGVVGPSKDEYDLVLYDIYSGHELSRLIGCHSLYHSLHSCMFLSDRYLASCGDLCVKIWDLASKKAVITLARQPVLGMFDFSRAFFFYETSNGNGYNRGDNSLSLFDWNRQRDVMRFDRIHAGKITGLKNMYGYKGKFNLVATSSRDSCVKLVDLNRSVLVGFFKEHEMGINAMEYDLTQQVLVTTSDDKTMKVWDAMEKKSIQSINLDTVQYNVLYMPKSRLILSTNGDGGASVRDMRKLMKKPITTYKLLKKKIKQISLFSEYLYYVSGEDQADLKVFNILGKEVKKITTKNPVVVMHTNTWMLPNISQTTKKKLQKFEEINKCDYLKDIERIKENVKKKMKSGYVCNHESNTIEKIFRTINGNVRNFPDLNKQIMSGKALAMIQEREKEYKASKEKLKKMLLENKKIFVKVKRYNEIKGKNKIIHEDYQRLMIFLNKKTALKHRLDEDLKNNFLDNDETLKKYKAIKKELDEIIPTILVNSKLLLRKINKLINDLILKSEMNNKNDTIQQKDDNSIEELILVQIRTECEVINKIVEKVRKISADIKNEGSIDKIYESNKEEKDSLMNSIINIFTPVNSPKRNKRLTYFGYVKGGEKHGFGREFHKINEIIDSDNKNNKRKSIHVKQLPKVSFVGEFSEGKRISGEKFDIMGKSELSEVKKAGLPTYNFDYLKNTFDPFDDLVGSGTYGKVFKCQIDGKDYAIKWITFKHNKNIEDQIDEFKNEIRILCKTRQHPYIIRIEGISNIISIKKECQLFFLTEYCPYKISGKFDTFSWKEKIKILFEVSEGMSFLHSLDLIHRDLKWDNVLLDSLKRAKIIDFGLSKITTSQSMQMTARKGTWNYLAPEIFEEEYYSNKKIKYGKQSDVYSFAMMMHAMLVNEEPFLNEADEVLKENAFCKPSEIIPSKVKTEGIRPKTDESIITEDNKWFIELMKKCWYGNTYEESKLRPTFDEIKIILKEKYTKLIE